MVQLRKVVSELAVAGVLLLGATGAASADGMPGMSYGSMPSAKYNWGGVYVGLNAGWVGTGDIGGPFVFPAAPGNSFIAQGQDNAIVGIHLGVQHQIGNIVFGVEAGSRHPTASDFASSPGLGNAPPIGCNAATVFSCQAQIHDIRQVGGRLGWAQNNWLFYGTGGYANAIIQTQATVNATGATTAYASVHHDGWFGGAGVEFALTKHVIIGVEYTHYDFDTKIHDVAPNSRFVDASADSVSARLSLKLGREDTMEPLK